MGISQKQKDPLAWQRRAFVSLYFAQALCFARFIIIRCGCFASVADDALCAALADAEFICRL